MHVRDLAKLIDQEGNFEIDSLSFPVLIKDVRMRFGAPDVLITPVSGSGERWVARERVTGIYLSSDDGRAL